MGRLSIEQQYMPGPVRVTEKLRVGGVGGESSGMRLDAARFAPAAHPERREAREAPFICL